MDGTSGLTAAVEAALSGAEVLLREARQSLDRLEGEGQAVRRRDEEAGWQAPQSDGHGPRPSPSR